MKCKLAPSILVFILLGVIAVTGTRPAAADDPAPSQVAPASTFVGKHYEGVVSTIDGAAQTGAITTRFGMRNLAFKLAGDGKIWKTQPMPARNLTVGAKVMVIGKEDDKTGSEVTPYVIDVLPDLPPLDNRQTPRAAGKGAILLGTLTSIGDDYTLADRSGRSITLKVRGNRMLVGQTLPATFTDIDEGRNIKLDGAYDGTIFVASRIVIQGGLGRREGGKGGKKTAITEKLPSLAAAGETAMAMAPVLAPTTTPTAPTPPGASPSTKPTPAPAPVTKFTDGDFGIYDLF